MFGAVRTDNDTLRAPLLDKIDRDLSPPTQLVSLHRRDGSGQPNAQVVVSDVGLQVTDDTVTRNPPALAAGQPKAGKT